MPQTIDARLLNRAGVYQDVRWAGQTLARGRRDCNRRWELIRPLLPARGALLDVGSNFGWFGLAACETFADYVVASVEADEQSAGVQRQVLQSHALRRIALLTHPAGSRLADVFARSGQRFDAVLCLSVLHWMRNHREFLTRLGPISGRMFIEHPDPREQGAGIDRIRREIGPIGRYLRDVFPDRHAILLGRIP
ncbi:MAG TPA: class I SAM-dependent methyltransferase, partial [Pirellulales bacterium]